MLKTCTSKACHQFVCNPVTDSNKQLRGRKRTKSLVNMILESSLQ